MNGKDLLKSMTAIDETYLKEAEEFAMKQKGGITMRNTEENFNPAEQETFEVGTAPKMSMFRNIAAAAACLLVCAGTFGGGIYLLNRAPVPEANFQTAEELTTETQVSETRPETTKSTTQKIKETTEIKETAPVETVVQEEILVMTFALQTETVPVIQTTVTTKTTQTAVSAVSTSTPETEIIQDITEESELPEITETELFYHDDYQATEAPAEIRSAEVSTETAPEETQPAETELMTETEPVETLIGRPGTYYLTATDENYFPGFIAKTFVCEIDEETSARVDFMYPILDGTEPEDFDTKYAPTYIPEEIASLTSRVSEIVPNQHRETRKIKYNINNVNNFGCEFVQFTKPSYCEALVYGSDSALIPLNRIEINGRHGWIEASGEDDGDITGYVVWWDNGDYVFSVSLQTETLTPDTMREEIIRIAESVQPVAD